MKFKSKTLLIDEDENNKIRPCYHNYARMSILEFMYSEIFVWKSVQGNIVYAFKELLEPIKEISWFIFNIVSLPILPITLYFHAKREIEKAKNEVWENKCHYCKFRKSSPILKGRVEDIIGIDECVKCKLVDGMPTEFVEYKENKIL